MARAWLIDGRTIARKVRNPTRASANEIKDWGANRECPNCHHYIDNSDVYHDWPGLPAGVKFDPSDAELLEHLAAKCGLGDSEPHALIDEFIPTLVEDKGICYTHPENFPGAKKDGSNIHFFYRNINAYATGQRKRRKVHNEQGSNEYVRWHKTGKTKSVIENGVQKGCKKIMVLYKNSKKRSKPDKSNWVMHQYHLGTDEDEKQGEYVVSKIFYQQQKQTDLNDDGLTVEDSDNLAFHVSPRTPITNPPNPPRHKKSDTFDDVADEKEEDIINGASDVQVPAVPPEDDVEYPAWLAGESQAVENYDFSGIDDSSLCEEIFHSSSLFFNSSGNAHTKNEVGGDNNTNNNNSAACGIADLENLELDTPPNFQLPDLQFSSQDSLGWIDRL